MKRLCLFAFFAATIFYSTSALSQLTDFTPTYHLEQETISGDSLLYATITFDDITDLGGIQLSVYDAESGVFIMEFQAIREEMINNGILTASELTVPLVPVGEDKQYRLDINPYTLAGSFLEHKVITTTL